MNYKKDNICAVIPIGGKGTRLKKITLDTPKPLFPINGKSTLFRACNELSKFGIKKIFITTSFNAKKCEEHISEIQDQLSLDIFTYNEEKSLGECGSLWKIRDQLNENIIFLNGDLIFSIAFNNLLRFHNRINSDITLVTHTSSHPEDSDLVSTPNGIQVQSIFIKSEDNHSSRKAYLGNAGIALFKKSLLEEIPEPININCSSLFHHLVKKSFLKNFKVFSYNTTEYIKDMGTPNRFLEIEKDLKKNLVAKNNYIYKQKALFLDRDNTLIKCSKDKYIIHESDLFFLDEFILKIARYAKAYNLVCLITNQPQISMGYISTSELDIINSVIVKYCLTKGLKIDVISFCPHHPHSGYEGEIKILKGECFCRKPQPGMLLQQGYLRNIDFVNSLFIGDSLVDKEAANSVNCPYLDVKDL